MILTVTDVRFTRGSPFGEQWWSFKDDMGNVYSYAMWTDLKSQLWPKMGQKVEIKLLPAQTCSLGGGSQLTLNSCAEIVRLIPE